MQKKQSNNYKDSILVKDKGVRLDIFLHRYFTDFSRTKLKNYILQKKILIDGESVSPSFILKGNERIEYNFSINDDNFNIKAEDIDIDIIYEDDSLIAINKPPGLVVHPGNGVPNGTLANALLFHYSKLSSINKMSPGIVHRLDKETSGIILVAKDDHTHWKLSKQFQDRSVNKIYRAIVWGNIKDSGIIKGLIHRDKKNRTKFNLNISNKGRFSESSFKKKKYLNPLSYVEIYPKTGRTHQIRVHLKSINNPIICDATYGGGVSMIKSFHIKYKNILESIMRSINRVALHAYSIEIEHPKTLKKIKFTAPIPDDFNYILKVLRDNTNV